jgi:heme-degrading monooxygenase HmoA
VVAATIASSVAVNAFPSNAALRPGLEKIPGFISIERFQSITNPEKILSLSILHLLSL